MRTCVRPRRELSSRCLFAETVEKRLQFVDRDWLLQHCDRARRVRRELGGRR